MDDEHRFGQISQNEAIIESLLSDLKRIDPNNLDGKRKIAIQILDLREEISKLYRGDEIDG